MIERILMCFILSLLEKHETYKLLNLLLELVLRQMVAVASLEI